MGEPRKITSDQIDEVIKILVEECGMRPPDRYCAFRYHVAEAKDPCREYRFMGDLGFGGKFRNNGNNNNTPHVDCYREHETPSRLAMIERANARLAALFAPPREVESE